MTDLHMAPISRADAKQRGLTRYFVWNQCPSGHTSNRLTVNGACEACSKARRGRDYRENRKENLQRQKARRDADADLPKKRRERAIKADPEYLSREAERARTLRLREDAKATGADMYETGTPCNSGHIGPRYTKTGKCVECNKILCAIKHEKRVQKDPKMVEARRARIVAKKEADARKVVANRNSRILRAAGEARRKAQESGDVTYRSQWPCSRNHVGLRYTSGGGCVECAAIAAASEEKRAYDAAYVAENKERILERSRVYAQNNREAVSARARAWSKANPEKRSVISKNYSHRRRTKEKRGVSTADLLAWEMSAKKVCYWCGVKCADSYHIDHYVPLSKDGEHELSNLVIACPPCNLRKSAKDPYAFAASVGRLF